MSGSTDIQKLLETMSPELSEESFVFVSCAPQMVPPEIKTLGTFHEPEGITLICEVSEAERHSFATGPKWKRITLHVHSSLEAIGFLKEITAALSAAKISCNAISAYYHDHLFVLESDAERALESLTKLSKNCRKESH